MDQKSKILDIAMNLNRIGNWVADGYRIKQKRIRLFLKQTTKWVESIKPFTLTSPFKQTFIKFLKEYRQLEKEGKEGPKDELGFAEKMMTWGNILTHRASLL
jgi:hypothetical protein